MEREKNAMRKLLYQDEVATAADVYQIFNAPH